MSDTPTPRMDRAIDAEADSRQARWLRVCHEGRKLERELNDKNAQLERITRHWTADAPTAILHDEAERNLVEGMKVRNTELELECSRWRECAEKLFQFIRDKEPSLLHRVTPPQCLVEFQRMKGAQ